MEVVNFKTKYSVGDKVYVVHGDEIKLGSVVGVIFRGGDGYEYDIEIGVSYSSQKLEVRRKETTVLPTLERAIEFAVNLYRKKLCDDWGFDIQDDGTVRPRQKQTMIVDWSNGFQGDGEGVKTKN